MTNPMCEHIQAATPRDLMRTSATVVWFFLMAATAVSWALGTGHAFIDSHSFASLAILVLAFVKVRFIGLYFMELKDSPAALRALLECYCLAACLVVVGFYLAG